MTMALVLLGGTLAGWALGMFQASSICERQGKDLMEAHDSPSPLKSKGSDMLLLSRAAEAFGLAWVIKLWLKPWRWGRQRGEGSGK